MGRPRKTLTSIAERFPTKPRADGRFQKRIRGRLYYFGIAGNREQALREYERVKHDLYAGRVPRARHDADAAGATVKQVAQEFLDEMWVEVQAGRLTEDWYGQHKRAIGRFVAFVGTGRAVADLLPEDFAAYGRHLVGKLSMGGNTFNRERSSLVAMFRWSVEHGRIPLRPIMGRGFARIPKGTIRAERKFRLIDPPTMAKLLSAAGPQLRAMILLGANAGFGAKECGELTWDELHAIRLEGVRWRVVRDRRAKTSISREAPLWPETVAALARIRRHRPADNLVFRTKYGNPWGTMSVGHAFQKLGSRHTFYDLRRTFVTYANETGDADAVKRIAGRKLSDMDDTYVQLLLLGRMTKVVNHVRARLLTPICRPDGVAPKNQTPA